MMVISTWIASYNDIYNDYNDWEEMLCYNTEY